MIIMKFVKPLTEEEIRTLKDCVSYHNNGRCRMRAHAILLSGKRHTINQIALIYDVDRDSVSSWLNGWDREGISCIYDAPKSGRPNKLTEEEQQKILAAIKENPRSIRRIIGIIHDEFGKDVSAETVKRLLKGLGQSWKRIRSSIKMLRNKEEFAKSEMELKELKFQHKAGVIDLQYFDESGFCLTPVVPYAWQPRGETIEIPASRSNRINVLGFMDIGCNFTPFVVDGIVDSEMVISCFDVFCKTVTKPTWVVIDNARIHTSSKFKEKMLEWEAKGLYLYYLPAYSPELNLIEILWRFIKYQWMPFSAYLSFANLKDSLVDILKNVGIKYQITFV
jgi:transposase